jgi:hypothetical protein
MSLADCLKKISGLLPEDVVAIKAAAEAKQVAGKDKATAEKEAVEEHQQRILASVEDLRTQLNAPQPVAFSSVPSASGRQSVQATSRGSSPSEALTRHVNELMQSDETRQAERLPGLPKSSSGPNPAIQAAAAAYMVKQGLPVRRQAAYVPADPARGKRIADAYEAMKNDPTDPKVKEAYDALAKETLAQWEEVKKLGLKIEIIKPGENPYSKGPTQVIDDLRNGHLWLFPTDQGFGTGADTTGNPVLAKTGETIDGKELVVNDIFRIVHDVFGHGLEGVGFGPAGEENAWQSHVRMFSPLAAKAMTSETRGQNSWVNYGPKGEQNRANQKETVYADQKVGLLPDWVTTEDVADDQKTELSQKSTTPGLSAEDQKKRQREIRKKIVSGLLDAQTREEEDQVFIAAGYRREGDFLLHPDVAPDFMSRVSDETKAVMKKHGVRFIDADEKQGGGTSLSYEGPHGRIDGLSVAGHSEFVGNARVDHVLRHETGHLVWSNELTSEQKDTFSGTQSVESAYGKRLQAGEVSSAASVHEEEFAERFAENGGDVSSALNGHKKADNQKTELFQKATKVPRTVESAVASGEPIRVVHWSTTPGLKAIDPKFAGTGGAGQEKGTKIDKRVFVGLAGRYRKEAALGGHPYETTVDPKKVYDLYADPLGLRAQAREKFPDAERDQRINAVHAAARKAGFDFFYSSKEGPWGPVLYTLDKLPVKPVEDTSTIEPKPVRATKAEEQLYAYGQPAIVTVGEKELGNTFASRRQFFDAPNKIDRDLERQGQAIPELQGTLLTRDNGRPIVFRVSSMDGDPRPVLSQGGNGVPYYVNAKTVVSTESGLVPGANTEPLSESASKQLVELTGDEAFREGMPVADAFKRLSRAMREDDAARALIDAVGSKTFGLDTLAWTGPDGRLRIVTEPDLLIDPETRRNARVLDQPAAPVRELSPAAQIWVDGLTPEQQQAIADDIAQRRSSERDVAGDLGNLQFALQAAESPRRKKKPVNLQQPGARGSIVLVGQWYFVNLYSGSDLSTLLHEAGHLFLEEMGRTVNTGYASAQTVEDYAVLMKWLGNKGEAITVAQHEQMASGTEAYYLRGDAPSAALRSAFGSFRRWLSRIYAKVVVGDPHAGIEKTAGFKIDLTPEVREVFDRMLSLPSEVNDAVADANFAPSVDELDKMLPEELRGKAKIRIDDLLVEARQKMEDRLFEHRAAAIAEQRPTWRKQAQEAADKAQVYKAVDFLKVSPLDRTQIQSEYGDAAYKTLAAKHGNLVTESPDIVGLDVDIAAEQLGYKDGKALVEALRKAPTKEGAVRKAVADMAQDQWQAYGPEDAMAETPEFAAVMEASRAYLAEALGRPGGVDKRALRKQAEQHIATMPVHQAVQVHTFLQEMIRLQREERSAAVQGDLAKALQKNAESRLNFELAGLARKAREEVKATVQRANSLRGLNPKNVEYQYLLNAQTMAERYGLTPATAPKNRVVLRQLMSERNRKESDSFEPAMDVAAAFPDWILDEQRAGKFQNMTLEDLADVDHMMRFLVARGKALRSSEVLDGKVRIERAVAQMLGGLEALPNKKIFEEGTIAGRIAGFADAYFAGLNIWQFRVRAMDGFTTGDQKTGPAEKYLFDPLHEKANERAVRYEKLLKMIGPAQKYLAKRIRSMPKYVDGLEATPAMKSKGRPGWTFENVLTVALNMGNSYNAEAMALGLGYTLEDGTPDVSKLHEITASMTKADWEAVVSISEAVHSQQADLSQVFEKRNGFPLALVEPEPFTVKTSDAEVLKLKGWYYPVKFDPTLSEKQEQQDDAADRELSSRAVFPLVGTRNGMTKRRTSTGGKPLLLTLSGLDAHLRDTVQYISYAETVVDVFRLTQHPMFKAAFEQKFGVPAFRQIRNMLADIGMPDQQVNTKADQFLGWLRGMSTAWALGLNVKTALVQPFSAINYAADEGWTSAAIGMKHVFSAGPTAAKEKMFLLSPFMKERWIAADREVSDSIRSTSWLANPKLKAVQDGMFSLIQISDHMTMLPLWWGSYYKRINAGATEAEAALGADKAILATYPGNPRPLDASAALRSKNGLIRLATSFATQAFHFGNRQRFYFQGLRAGKVSPVSFAAHVAVEGIAAPIIITMFFEALLGNWPPEDKDYDKYLLSLGNYQLTGLPIIKELANTVSRPERGIGGNISALRGLDMLAGAGSTVSRLASDMEDGKDPKYKKAVLALADLVSFYYKIPASRVYERTMRGLDQLDQFHSDDEKLNYLNKLFTILAPDPDKRTK